MALLGYLFAAALAVATFLGHRQWGADGAIGAFLSMLILGGGLYTMTRRNPVTAVVSLVFTFFFLAILYATLSAHFVAVLQVLVYAGAIMVLFIFVVMILNREEAMPVSLRGLIPRALAVGAAIYLLVTFAMVLPGNEPAIKAVADPAFGTVAAVGDLLFKEFVFPFEAVSLLLLVAIVGGVVVSRSARGEEAAVALAAQYKEIQTHRSDEAVRVGGDQAPDAHGGGHH